MPKIAPDGEEKKKKKDDSDSGSDSGKSAESDGESEDESKQPPLQIQMDKIQGYENVKFGGSTKDKVKPPATENEKKEPKEKIKHDFQEMSNISEEECREALIDFADKSCCFGTGAAKEMSIEKTTPSTAHRYILETYSEKRTTSYESEPFKGQQIDGPENGPPPEVWSIKVTFTALFKDEVIKREIPHTAVVKDCGRCGGCGKVKCTKCKGSKKMRCSLCHGRGRRRVNTDNGWRTVRCGYCGGDGKIMCIRCVGTGKIKCKKCDGTGQLRCFILLRVKFKNHKDEYIHETTDMPDKLVKEVDGTPTLQEEDITICAIDDYSVKEVNENSAQLIHKHKTSYADEILHRQRHKLIAVPVTEVEAKYDKDKFVYWVYGNQRKVHSPDYPQKCCWGCQIL